MKALKEAQEVQASQSKVETFKREALPHFDSLYRMALRLTRNEKDAEDLLQDTYLKAFKAFHQFKPGTNARAWLFKIMSNHHINNQLSKSRKSHILSFDAIENFYLYNRMTDYYGQSGWKNVEDEVLDSFVDREVKEAVGKLPYNFRMTVLLADVEGFKYSEIAEILNCPLGTVRSRLHRGRLILQKLLWEYFIKRRNGKSGRVRSISA